MNFNKFQKRAIESDAGDITVSASAGTGKTSVLSQRCLKIISDSRLCPDVSGVLVLTFTDAAAGEMKSRIAHNLKQTACRTNSSHLHRQLLLLDSADIRTIDSFCKSMLTANFHYLGIDPSFKIIESDENKLLKTEILDDVIEQAWSQDGLAEALKELLDGRSLTGRNNFLNSVIQINDFMNNIVSKNDFYDRAAVLNEAVLKTQSEIIKNKLTGLRQQLEYSLKLDAELACGHWHEHITKYIEIFSGDDFLNRLDEMPNWPRKPRGFDDALKDLIQQPARNAVEAAKKLSGWALLNPKYADLVSAGADSQTKTLLELVKRFDIAYRAAKQRLNCLDFADLEHYMLRLLEKDGEPTEIALRLGRQYRYIFIDEYQDINPVQQKIIDLLSTSAKIFVVGDVKQSIYGFRGADCSLFIDRLKADSSEVEKIYLNENFRSNPAILKFVNAVFSKIMTSEIAGVSYDSNAALTPASGTEVKAAPAAELLLINQSNRSDDNSRQDSAFANDKANQRAIAVSHKIKQLVEVDKLQIFDKHSRTYRSCRWGDIVILMRSFTSAANYIQVLTAAGIPVISDSSTGYFETTEITDMLCLLKVLDNPQQDIPLAAVLRSPVFGITDSQLAEIKLHSRVEGNLYFVLEKFSHQGTVLSQRISEILSRIDEWRTLARFGSLADLIWQIYCQSGYLTFISARTAANQRYANLLKLYNRAIQFENFVSSQTVSLGRFVNFIEKLIDSGQDWSPAEPDSSASNAVSICTVHRSKGLEYPIVILAETGRAINSSRHLSDCLADESVSVGLRIIDSSTGGKLETAGWQIIKETRKLKDIAEEMRILYVAMTRARDRLIITGGIEQKRCVELLSSIAFSDSGGVDNYLIESARSTLDWLIMALGRYECLNSCFELPVEIQSISDRLFDFEIYEPEDIAVFEKSLIKPPCGSCTALASQDLRTDLLNKLSWEYKYQSATVTVAKQTVTDLIKTVNLADEYADSEFSLETLDNDSLLIGSACHLVLQQIDLANVDVEDTISRLVKNSQLTEDIAEKLAPEKIKIAQFFSSPLGKTVLANKQSVLREWPFTYGLKDAQDTDTVIIQGIIDMLVELSDELIIIDFKTNHSVDAQLQEKYRKQLQWYSRAAADILNKPVKAAFLYYLNLNQQVQCVP